MAQTTIEQFATDLKMPAGALLEQLTAAGVAGKKQGDKLTLKATKEELRSPVNSHLAKDNSPEISQYMDEINRARQGSKTGGGLGIQDETNRPASAGSMGEDKAGGGGPSGTPSLPQSGQAPGFEGGNPSSKR